MADHQVRIKKESSSHNTTIGSDGGNYPFGTSINIEDDLVTELNADNLAVGDVVEVRGFAFVDSKYEHSDKESTSKSIRLQITSLKIERETDDAIKTLYGD